jgi:hypothetical protein
MITTNMKINSLFQMKKMKNIIVTGMVNIESDSFTMTVYIYSSR